MRRQEVAQVGDAPSPPDVVNHVVLCGYGRVGTVLGDVLDHRGFPYTVVEINPLTVRELRDRGVPAFYGDAGSDALLIRAGIEHAGVLVVTVTDLVAARAAIRRARALNSGITIVTRATTRHEVDVHRDAGADVIIQPEYEAGLQFVHHVLRRIGLSPNETGEIVASRRAVLYKEGATFPYASRLTQS